MNRTELETVIEEEIYNYLDEKSVPQPYDRKNRRRMSKAQIADRDSIGKKMKANAKTVARFRKKHGDEWEDYLWRAATGKAMGGGFKKKGGSTSKKSKSKAKKKPSRNKSNVKLSPDQKKNADAMYKQLQRLAKKDGKLDEGALLRYAGKLEQKFLTLNENHSTFDGVMMTKLLHKMVEKIITTGEQQ